MPLSTFVQVAVLTVGTMGFSNASLAYLTYPTQVCPQSTSLSAFAQFRHSLGECQFGCTAVLATVLIGRGSQPAAGFATTVGMLLSVYTDAPDILARIPPCCIRVHVQVVFKSCKLIPVMFGGILIQGKSYSKWEFLASFVLSLGLATFTLADVAVQPNFSLVGVALISTALCADAAIGNVQEKVVCVPLSCSLYHARVSVF